MYAIIVQIKKKCRRNVGGSCGVCMCVNYQRAPKSILRYTKHSPYVNNLLKAKERNVESTCRKIAR